MMSMRNDATGDGAGWRKVAVLVLVVIAVGLPVNHFGLYVVLLGAAVIVFTGEVTARPASWLAALAIVAVAIAGQWLLAPPRIDEGHNVFLPGEVLQKALPAEVYKRMADEFDALYPPPVRCKPDSAGCWQGSRPERAFAFSADSVLHKSDLSRSVTAVDFADPVWLHLGFINDRTYNWYTNAPDVRRLDRDRRFYMGLRRWHIAMPWFDVIRLPPAYVGGQLCWRGDVMWEGDDGKFALLSGGECRTITAADAGHRVFGLAITPDTLAMRLTPPWRVKVLKLAALTVALVGLIALLAITVRINLRRTIWPLVLIGLAALVIAVDDASFLGGMRPFDGGDDGLFYDGVGREILQNLLVGDIAEFLRGGENVFYYGGPGLRYARAIEHIVFGESYLGYLSLVLTLPFLVYFVFRRFLPNRWSLAGSIVFTAIPVGALFGTTFFQYAVWASRGFADPAAYILFIAALLPLMRPPQFTTAFFAALLFALAICMKPIIAPATAVMLGGAGLAALDMRQWRRLTGLCIGFLPVFSMALHNWVFGHVFVLFSSNAGDSQLLTMPPSAYVAAVRDLATMHFGAPDVARIVGQIVDLLRGPAQVYAAIPLSIAALVILIAVIITRRFDPWLRLVAAAALTQHAVALFYNSATARYHFLSWFLTMVVVLVWFREVGIGWLQRRYPALCARISANPLAMRLASGLGCLHKVSA